LQRTSGWDNVRDCAGGLGHEERLEYSYKRSKYIEIESFLGFSVFGRGRFDLIFDFVFGL